MAKALELTWIASLSQWRKRRNVGGKRKDFYLGTGNGKDDRASYERALAKWRIKEAELNAQDAADALQAAYAKWGESLAARDHTNRSPCACQQTLPSLPEPRLRGDEVHPSMQRWMDGTARMGEDRPSAPPKPKAKTLDAHIDDYIAEQRERYEHGLRFPDAPQDERISPARFIAYRWTANVLREIWFGEPLPEGEAGLEALMERFRSTQKREMTEGRIKPSTFNERVKTLRHFLGFLYRKRLIASIPRETERLCAKHAVRSTARALDVETVRLIWRNASPRLKTYIALALNCGFYAVDIANLERAHIQGDHIACNRHKTGVPTRFKLWPLTKRLLAENGSTAGRLALTAQDGGPLLVVEPDAESGRGRRWSQIDNDLAALKKRIGLTGVSFSNLRDTSSTRIESIDRSLTDLFDGHKDARMARFYVDGSKIDPDRMFAGLDRAVSELEAFYTLEADSAV
jgi:integrase